MSNYVQSVTVGGLHSQRPITRTVDHENPYGPITLAAAQTSTLTTRTDDDTGLVTKVAHGYSVGDVVDVYWSGAGNVRYGMSVATVPDADTYTVDGGAGDVLPAQATVLTVAEQQVVNTDIKGDQIALIFTAVESTSQSSTSNAHLHLKDAQDKTILQLDLVANAIRVWDVTGGDTNDFNPSVTDTFTADNTTEIITSTSAHGLLEGHQVRVSNSGGGLPAGLTAGVWYFVKYLSTTTFSLALTLGGAAINITTNGTGTQTWTRRNVISKCLATQGSASETLTLKIGSSEDTTP